MALVVNPSVPYIRRIYGGRFKLGQRVRIQGRATGNRFNINLQCGPETAPLDDVAVQVSVQLLEGDISVNSLQNGIWNKEQCGLSWIKRGDKFEIILTCELAQYKVAINGQQYCEFPQRISYDRITHLAIDGDVSIIRISYELALGNIGGVLQASVPISVPSIENEEDGFGTTNTNLNESPQPGMNSPPSPGSVQPPSYEAALSPPYPTSDPVGMPCPGVVPGVSDTAPYPPARALGIPLPSRGELGIVPPPRDVPTIPPPPALNAASSNFRPVKNNDAKKYAVFCAFVVGAVIIMVIRYNF